MKNRINNATTNDSWNSAKNENTQFPADCHCNESPVCTFSAAPNCLPNNLLYQVLDPLFSDIHS